MYTYKVQVICMPSFSISHISYIIILYIDSHKGCALSYLTASIQH